jgi:hypothetical protein
VHGTVVPDLGAGLADFCAQSLASYGKPTAAGSPIADLFRAVLVYEQRMEDRRAAPRQPAHVSAALETAQGRSTIAITRDISSRGLLLLTRAALEVGELVKLTVALAGSPGTLSGKVVRVEDLEDHELWRYKAAIIIDDGDPVLAQLHAALPEPGR